jgi:beta-glucosidase
VELQPGESKTVTFRIPLKQLAFVGTDLKKHLEAGDFNIQVGNQQQLFSVNKTLVY